MSITGSTKRARQRSSRQRSRMHCTECKQEFKVGNWDCLPGQKHIVASKRYYMDDAPTVPEWRDGHPFVNKGASRTEVLNIPPERQVKVGEDIIRMPGGTVVFVRGMFETSDPEIQYYLDKKPGDRKSTRLN